MKIDDCIIGTKVGKLTIIGPPFRIGKRRKHIVCQCDCGEITVVRTDGLGYKTFSCGCIQKDKARKHLSELVTTHGASKTDKRWIYQRVKGQQDRCNNPNRDNYCNYGGRGIEFRFESVEKAVEYYLSLPNCSPDMEIDRIDNDGHYEPGNVRWVTRSENLSNRRKYSK